MEEPSYVAFSLPDHLVQLSSPVKENTQSNSTHRDIASAPDPRTENAAVPATEPTHIELLMQTLKHQSDSLEGHTRAMAELVNRVKVGEIPQDGVIFNTTLADEPTNSKPIKGQVSPSQLRYQQHEL
jgi:hypothetical protein